MTFSDDFLWGAATAAYQIEGAYDEDGKGLGFWDVLSPGHVDHGDTGNIACDHYHRSKEDIELMKKLGIKAYRFSVSWPRIIPSEGRINEKGLNFYKDLVTDLTEAGITPLCTLYHWDLPMWAYEKGGWLGKSISDDFAEFAKVVVQALSDKVSYWMPFNEPTSFIGEGYLHGTHPPYIKAESGSDEEHEIVLKTTRNVLLAHGKAAKIIRENAKLSPKIGIATDSMLYMPDSDSIEDVEKAKNKTFKEEIVHYHLNWWLDPIMKGTGHPALMSMLSDDEIDLIHNPLDFIGWNCYAANNYNDGPDGTMSYYWPGIPRTDMGWPITPDALYWGVKFIYERYKTPVMITENGFANVDFVMDDGHVHDPQRIQYLKWYISGLKRAADEGCPVLGYMVWSLLDNFEWAFGLSKRFGLTYINYLTEERIPKDSFYWYKKVIETNGEDLSF
ncbi:MAG: family 1 glycosylhydrolase [Eubacterium sp.]|nr:family 1 glycosylhydrolase [Eubacterium sp.]